jgi:putrescine aminotransferase
MPRSSDMPQRVATARPTGAALMVRISGPNMILSPPLVIQADEVELLADRLEAAFAAVQDGL